MEVLNLHPSFHNLSRDMTKPTQWVCAQRRLGSTWTSAQSVCKTIGYSALKLSKIYFIKFHTFTIFCLVHSAVRFCGSCQERWLGLGCVSCKRCISYLMSAAAMCCGSWRLTLGSQVSWVMSVEVARFRLRVQFPHAPQIWCLQLSYVTDLGGWCV